MKRRRLYSLGFITLVNALMACQGGNFTPTGLELSHKQNTSTINYTPLAFKARLVTTMATTNLQLKVKSPPAEAIAQGFFKLLALPGNWSTARVTLHSPTANGTFTESINAISIARSLFGPVDGAGYQNYTATFPPLRPATDYRAELFLFNSAGTPLTNRLGGSQTQVLTLNASSNDVAFNAVVNGNELSYQVANTVSTANNKTKLVSEPYTLTTFAGSTSGMTDAVGVAAQFRNPWGIARLQDGRLLIVDQSNHSLRTVHTEQINTDPTQTVKTFLGTGTGGSSNTVPVTFGTPSDACQLSDGSILVADQNNNYIRQAKLNGVTSYWAGNGAAGNTDGTFTTGNNIQGARAICYAPLTNEVFVSAQGRIRKINPTSGVTTTLTTTGTFAPNPGGTTYTGVGTIHELLVSPTGNYLYFVTSTHRLFRVNLLTPAAPEILAGTGGSGLTDNINPLLAQFNQPYGMTFDFEGNLLITDYGNSRIRKYNITTGEVSTVISTGLVGCSQLVRDPLTEAVYVTEYTGHKIMRLMPSVTRNIITKDDTLTIETGLAPNQPGVDRVEVSISGAAYSGPKTLVKRFTSSDSATWNSFSFNTANAQEAYLPGNLSGGAGTNSLAATLFVEAYDRYNVKIGESQIPAVVYGKPNIIVRIQ
jgi:hypothetical protein